jgi:hypothetical protein
MTAVTALQRATVENRRNASIFTLVGIRAGMCLQSPTQGRLGWAG